MSDSPVLAYHRRSCHRPGQPAAAPASLDRSIEPVPFRRYRGAELLPLPEIPLGDGPAWGDLFVLGAIPAAAPDRDAVARLFFDSLAISAWREESGTRISFRVNPSAGNLHPTEAYLLAGPIPGLRDRPTLYHYSPFDHGLEVLADLPDGFLSPGTLFIGFTTILWRTAWKYGERAFRLAHLDAGHAMAALSYAAATLGWKTCLMDLEDDDLAHLLGVHNQRGPERETPVALVEIAPSDLPLSRGMGVRWERGPGGEVHGRPNRISPGHRSWPALDEIIEATRRPLTPWPPLPPPPLPAGRGGPWTGPAVATRSILRNRRSAVAFSGEMTEREISHLLTGGSFPLSVPGSGVRLEPLLQRDGIDFRSLAGHQAFASGASFLAVLLGDLEPALAPGCEWLYRRLHWEAGARAHSLSLQASALGFGARGIGGFFEEEALAALGLPPEGRWQALYLLAVGRTA